VASPGGSLQAQLDAAEKEWEAKGGDRSNIIAIRRKMQAAGVSR
jgi:hypothetical protein